MTSFEDYLKRLAVWSRGTFGAGQHTERVIDHIKKELDELASAGGGERPFEWADVAMLGLDGLMRSLIAQGNDTDDAAERAVQHIITKQNINERRDWPDWRTANPEKAIEHDRSADQRRAG